MLVACGSMHFDKNGPSDHAVVVKKPHRESPPSAMNNIERGRVFLQWLQALAARSAWDWKQCLACGSRLTIKNGSYTRRPWFFTGRQCVRV